MVFEQRAFGVLDFPKLCAEIRRAETSCRAILGRLYS